MPIYRTDRNQTWDSTGNLVVDETVEVDVTEEVTEWSLHDAARQALVANRTFLGLSNPSNGQTLAQVRSLTRQNQGLVRLVLGLLDGID